MDLVHEFSFVDDEVVEVICVSDPETFGGEKAIKGSVFVFIRQGAKLVKARRGVKPGVRGGVVNPGRGRV